MKNLISRAFPLLALIFLVLNISCSHMQDGKFVQIGTPYDLPALLSIYGMSEDNLRQYNPGKSFEDGQWVFIPRHAKSIVHRTSVPRSSATTSFRLPAELNDATKNISFVWPIKQNPRSISSPFGERGRGMHDGIDIPSRRGTKVYAAASGRVIYCKRMKGYGRTVILDHGGGVHTIYAHNSKNIVRVGDRVTPKSVLGLVGASGRATGNHLHFEIRIHGEAYDPVPFLERDNEVYMVNSEDGAPH
jgi:murein DD-endopeptidase MepM/ murein hydrolase activator NlpD